MPKYEIMGWYATGKALSEKETAMYQQVIPFNEAPLLLLLDVHPDASAREIPMSLYETEHKVGATGTPELKFLKSIYRIETTDSERLAVDHVARASNVSGDSGNGPSQLTAHLDSMSRAIKMLRMRIGIIIEYLQATQTGDLTANLALIRRISALTKMLPGLDSNLQQELLNEHNDAVLLTYLATVMKAASTVNDLIDKFNLTYDKHGRRRSAY